MSTLEIVDLINAEDRMVAQAVGEEREQIARAIDLVVDTFDKGGRLFYVGAGTSGRLGVLDAAEMPPTYGTDPELVQGIIAGGYAALVRAQEGAEDHPEDGARDLDERGVTGQGLRARHRDLGHARPTCTARCSAPASWARAPASCSAPIHPTNCSARTTW